MKQACTLTNFKSLKQKVESNTIITNQKSFSNTKFIYDTESEDSSLNSNSVNEYQPAPKQPPAQSPETKTSLTIKKSCHRLSLLKTPLLLVIEAEGVLVVAEFFLLKELLLA